VGFSESFSRYNSSELLPPTGEIWPDQIRRLLSSLAMNSVPILIIDEFDRLKRKTKRAIADAVKALSDHAVAATLVIVGVADTVDELIEEHQSVERALLQIRMPRMSDEEIAQIIKTGLKRLTMSIDAAALRRIVALSQGLPHYAHSLGLFSSRMALDSGTKKVTLTAVDKAIDKALVEAQQSIRSAWHTATTSARRDALFSEVLMACALAQTDQFGFFAAQHVREPLSRITGKRYEIPSFAQHLNDFSDEKRGNVLEKRGGRRNYRYRFNNPLMQPFAIMQGFSSGKISGAMLNADTKD
jgi:Cdc6-like AAA superfamily ATPase